VSAGELFTAEEIGRALGKTRFAMRRALVGIAPTGTKLVRGNSADAWSIEALPCELRGEIFAAKERRHYRSVADVIANPPARFELKIPLAEIADDNLAKARKLREALAWSLAKMNDTSMREAEFSERGRADYLRAFGYEISGKQLRRLLERTIARDAGALDWDRLEVYVDDKCGRKNPASSTTPFSQEHAALRDTIAAFKNPAAPTKADRTLLWQRTFDEYGDLIAGGADKRKVRRSIVDFLWHHAPSLAKSTHAMYEAFNAKLKAWEAGEIALLDGRAVSNKERRLILSKDDRLTILAFAKKYGSLSQGWREAVARGALGPELALRYIENPASKSHVPTAIRMALGNDVQLVEDWIHGPRQAKLNGAYIDRLLNFAAGDWMQGDDCTLPVLYYEETANGPRLMRGQFLAMIDVRSQYVLGWVLISAPEDRPSTYNAWHIRNLITTVHDVYGLPRNGFYFENGTWKAKLLTGNTADWTETETGLRAFGTRFIHARLPRAKIIERVFGSLQNYMEGEPGYVGRGWHNDKYERVERTKRFVESGKLSAPAHFYSRDEWVERLTDLVNKFNDERQHGKYCAGLSPRDAYEKNFGIEQVVRLPESARYLLANERKLLKVGRNGVGFRIGREAFTYKSAETGPLQGRSVVVYFNRESPDVLGVKHPESGEVFAVRRATSVPAFEAESEVLAQAFAENAAHDSHKRALYRAMLPKFSEHFTNLPIFRQTLVDRATADAGRQLEESRQKEREKGCEERKLRESMEEAAGKVGMTVRGEVSERRRKAAVKLANILSQSDEATE